MRCKKTCYLCTHLSVFSIVFNSCSVRVVSVTELTQLGLTATNHVVNFRQLTWRQTATWLSLLLAQSFTMTAVTEVFQNKCFATYLQVQHQQQHCYSLFNQSICLPPNSGRLPQVLLQVRCHFKCIGISHGVGKGERVLPRMWSGGRQCTLPPPPNFEIFYVFSALLKVAAAEYRKLLSWPTT